jgi:peroxiredoxin
MTLAIGDPAPDFTLKDQHGQDKAALIVFYPFAFSGVCTGELTGLRDRLGDFETDHSTLLAVSCDPMYAQRAVADRDGIFFPLLSDFWPHGVTARDYGVFDDISGSAKRSSFIVDKDGRVGWMVHNATGEARDLDEHAARLSALV